MRLLTVAAVLWLAGCANLPGPDAHVHGRLSISPCRPVERPGDPPCPPAAGVRIVFDDGRGTVVASVTDASGGYSVSLPPGRYGVRVHAGMAPNQPVERVTLAPGQDLKLDLSADSGIR